MLCVFLSKTICAELQEVITWFSACWLGSSHAPWIL